MKINKKTGFTLIELLVVVSIIGLLSSVVLSALNSARARGRSAALISGAQEMQKALLFYYDKNNGVYPPNTPDGGAIQYTSIRGVTTEAVFRTAITPTFLEELPDPGTFINASKFHVITSRLLYSRLSNDTVPGCSGALGNCYAILFYPETSTVFGPANTAVYFLSNGEIRKGYDGSLY